MVKLYTKNGRVKPANRIVIFTKDSQIINPTEEMILADGWVEYVPPVVEPQPYRKGINEVMQEIVMEQYNQRTDIGDAEALERMIVIYNWDKYIGQTLKAGQVCVYHNKVYRSRQEHTVLEVYYPSKDTASLYEVIEKIHTGKKDDPIPYTPPMEIFEGKYYTQNNVLYICTRDGETALTHDLNSLVGLYVEIA